MAADRPITPEQAALAAKAAGLDLDRPLNEQLQSDQNGDLEQRVADRSERVETLSEALGAAGQPAEPHELLAERLHAAQSEWLTLGGPDDGAA